jgi:ribA/ribD-fused uncharacterized protein
MAQIFASNENEIRFYRAVGKFGFLSSLWPCRIFLEDQWFPTAEHAYQYAKFKDPLVREWVMQAPKPHLVALVAHNLFVYDIVPNWQAIKVERMQKVIAAKFNRIDHLDIVEGLIATFPKILIEDSKMDNYWGIGKKGTGQNKLGNLLMERRKQLQAV